MSKTSDYLSVFDEARDYLKLETNKAVSWCFEGWDKEGFTKTEILTGKDDQGNEKRYARIAFTQVIDLMAKEQRPKRFSTTSEKLCKKLFAYFERGSTCLEITRTGEGRDTDYEIYPIDRPAKEAEQK